MKKVLILSTIAVLAVVGVMLLASPGQSRNRAYYSGEAASYNGKVYAGTVNSGSFELFEIANSQIYKKTTIQSLDRESGAFADLLFEKSGNKLFVYLINGRYLYKYDISNPVVPKQEAKIKDNSWDWFSRLGRVNGQLATIGSKGVKVWNKDLVVVNAYGMFRDRDLGSAVFSPTGELAINLKGDDLKIYSTASRDKVAEYSIASADKKAIREVVGDSDDKLIYVVDDKSLKAIGLDGMVKKEFKHISNVGYDVAESANPDYLYFSDGIGIVKVNKDSFKPVKWAYSYIGTPAGSWSMGLKAVRDGLGEKVVVFNGSNIWVLDENLKTVATYESQEIETRPIEDLFLSADKNRAAPGTEVSLRGGGFGLEENLKIEFAGIKQVIIRADKNGRFQQVLTVPSVLPTAADIKVIGQTTKKTYSISFKID